MTLARCRGPLLLLLLSLSGLCLAHHTLPAAPVGVSPAAMTPEASMPPDPTGRTPIPTPSTPPASPTPAETIVMTIVYDNRPFDPALTTAWGFSCLIRTGTESVLFDTGGDGAILMANMASLQIDPDAIDLVVLSHDHRDHTGGLAALLEENDHLAIFVPGSFADRIGNIADERADVVAVSQPMLIADGIWALGEMGDAVVEQALAVQTSKGLVVVTGCAHPGLPTIIDRARTLGEVDMLIGGFHLRDADAETIRSVIAQVRSLGVRCVAPCHCTGEAAVRAFQDAFGPDFFEAGVGARFVFER